MSAYLRRAAATQSAPRFTVGCDHHGWWVVHDGAGLVGGIFASEDAAMHFASGECARFATRMRRAARSEVVELGSFTSDHFAVVVDHRHNPESGHR